MPEVWKSPRKIEEEARRYRHDRFEQVMTAVDRGEISRALGIRALTEDLNYWLLLPEGENSNGENNTTGSR